MKEQVRVLGIDDAPFRFKEGKVPVIGALMRGPDYLEAVMATEVTVDGDDADQAIERMVVGSRYQDQIGLVLIDGVALGGFNVIDIGSLHDRTDLPFATITRDRPDLDAIRSALQKHFDDWRERMEVITRQPLHTIETDFSPIFATFVGVDKASFELMVRRSTVRGVIPEPLRVAHLIATAWVKGESRGRA
jgi:endonuclease V-like protein UPF0215 family